jgi:predicted RNA-binding protein
MCIVNLYVTGFNILINDWIYSWTDENKLLKLKFNPE